MAKRKAPAKPGDMRMDPLSEYAEQPLSDDEKALVDRAYKLFRFFYDKHKEEHEEIRDARLMRRLKHERSATSPAGNTLNSSIDNVIADQIDNMPEALLIPERMETAKSAEEMTDVVSFVMYQSGWPGKYQKIMEDAAVTGTGVAEVFWDDDAMDGEGMVSVLSWHPEDIYPDPQYEDIQNGRAIFKVTHTTVAWVEEHYPDAKGYVRQDEYTEQDEQSLVEVPEGDQKVTLIEFWYKRYDAKKRKNRVHMAQVAGGALLYSSELDYGVERKGEFREGIYAHGEYPFVLFKYRDVPGRPYGTGLVHDYRETQKTIDRYYKYIDDNARQSSLQRMFIRRGCGVNADEVADMSRVIIEWEGNDIREVLQPMQAAPLNSQVFTMTQYLSDMMKQDSGQNQFSRGEGGLGVTAASAIEALQEAGGKITRWHTEQFKDAFRKLTEQILWVLSEYLEPTRTLHIVGGWDMTGNMIEKQITLNIPAAQGDALPKPAYTVRVQVQKHNPLTLQSQNELLVRAAEVCAQSGTPLPPETFISLLQGYPNKTGVLKAVQANSKQAAEMEQLRQQVAALAEENEKLKKNASGLEEALFGTQGGGEIMAAQGEAAPDYQAFMEGGAAK